VNISINLSDYIAIIAVAISSYAAWTTTNFNRRQKSLIESQEKLNKLLVQREEEGVILDKKAELGATIIKLGNNNHRLKIWNKGKAAARNVSITFPEGNDFIIDSELAFKFPLERLEAHQSVDLIAAVYSETKLKQVIKITWSDDFDDRNEKVVYITL
jgi:hypothetical protein